MLPDYVTLELFKAMEDQRITAAEVRGMMWTVFNSAIAGTTMAFGMVMFDRVIKSNPGSGKALFTEAARKAKIETIVTDFAQRRHFTSVVTDGGGIAVFELVYEELEDRIALVSSFARPGYAFKGYGTRVFVEGPLALSLRTGKPLVTVGLTDDGRLFYRALERRGLVVINEDPLHSGVFIMKPTGGNPGNPSNPGEMTPEIISRAGLKEYEYRYFPPTEEERKPRLYAYTRRRTIGSYEIQMTRTDDSCMVKLYEFLPGWKRKLRATWTGIGKAECDKKFEEVVETVVQVRFEHKTALGR